MDALRTLFTALLLASLAGTASGAAYPSWAYRRDILFNTTGSGAPVAGNVADFPVCVRLHAGNFDFAQGKPDGSDIRFADADGTPLAYEIERWDKAKAVAEIWVKVPQVDGNSAADRMTMHWGKGDALSESDGKKVFASASGFVAAWHLSEGGTGARANSVGAANPANPVNYDGDESRPGVVGMADSLVPSLSSGGRGEVNSGDYLDLGPGFEDFTGGFTYSVWVWLARVNSGERFLDLGNGEYRENIILGRHLEFQEVYYEIWSTSQSNGGDNIFEPNLLDQAKWQHYTVTQTGTQAALYKNGMLVKAKTLDLPIRKAVRNRNFIGRSNWAVDEYLQGKIDEPQIAKVSRSADWIKLTYESQRPDSKLLAFGPVQETVLSITTQPPGSVALKEGEPLTLAVAAVSTLPIVYKWLKDGQVIASTTMGRYSIAAAKVSDAGTWSCQLTDGKETVHSTNAIVTVSENPALWSRSLEITLNTTAAFADVADKVTDFPLLLRLTTANFDFSQAAAGGADIRFLDASGAFLPHHIPRWRVDLKEAEVWVRLPEVAPATGGNKVTMIWGRADAAQKSSGSAVFAPSSGWRGAWQLDEAAGITTAADATGNGFTGASTGAVSNEAGLAGKGFRFAGGADRILLPAAPTQGLKAFSLTLWARETKTGDCVEVWTCPMLTGMETGTNGSRDLLVFSKAGKLGLIHGLQPPPTSGPDRHVVSDISLNDGKWHHVAVTYDGAFVTLYEAGKPVGQIPANGEALADQAFDIGNAHWNDGLHKYGFSGALDEYAIAGVARSAAWIKLAYETQRPDAFAVGYGSPATLPLPPVTAFPPAGSHAAPLTVTLSAAPGAAILYTLDGTSARENPSAFHYAGPIALGRDARIRAVAHKDGKISEELVADYDLSRTLLSIGRDTLRAGDTVALGDGHFLTPGSGSGVTAITAERLPLPGSVTGFDRTGPLLRVGPTKEGAGFSGLFVTGSQDGTTLYRLDGAGPVRMPAPGEGFLMPSAGDYFWGRDTAAPRIAWLGSGSLGSDSVRAAFRVSDNVRLLGVHLRWHSSREDSSGWIEAASGDSLSFAIALASGAAPLEISLAASDGAFTVRYPSAEIGAITLSRPLPGSIPIALPAGKWTLAGLPLESDGSLTFADLARANGGSMRAAVWQDNPANRGTGAYRLLAEGDAVPTGGALWLSAPASHKSLSFPSPRSLASDSAGAYALRLGPGWNLVSNPSLRPLPWPVRRADLDAYTASAVKGPHGHDGDRYAPTDTLLPWRGYYVFNHGADTVVRLGGGGWLAAKRTSPGAPPSAKPAATPTAGLDLLLAARGGPSVTQARLGARAWALDGLGREDEFSPPPPEGIRTGLWLLRGGRALCADVVRWQEGTVSRWTVASRGAPSLSLGSLAAPEGTEVWAAFPSRGLKLRLAAGDVLAVAEEDTLLLFAGPPASLAALPELRGLADAPPGAEARLVLGPAGWELALALPGSARVSVRGWRADGKRLAGFDLRKAAGWHRIPLRVPGRGVTGPLWVQVEARGEGWTLRRLLPANFTGFAGSPGK